MYFKEEMKMSVKRILLTVLILTFCFASAQQLQARNIVVPTHYGYGVVSTSALVKPYIAPGYYYPYASPAWAYNGYYYNYYNVAPAFAPATYALPAVPAWNGMYWYYQYNNHMAASSCNLNIRSEPYVAGKKKNSNVIGSLKTGEQVYLLGQSGNWYLVQSVFAPLRRGYVYGPYLRFYGAAFDGYYAYPSTLIRAASW